MSKTERQTEVEALTAELAASPNLYVTDFRGLNVQRMTEFRRRLRGAGARYAAGKMTRTPRPRAPPPPPPRGARRRPVRRCQPPAVSPRLGRQQDPRAGRVPRRPDRI